MIDLLVIVFLFGLLAVSAVAVIQLENLFAAAMLTGIYSLLSAGLFVVMEAVDVAFTEAAVGAGVSTILMLGALGLSTDQEKKGVDRPIAALIVVVLTGASLVYGTLDLPRVGDPNAPIHHHVADHYIQESGHEIGVPNIVTSVLASYRGYDTLGETTVVLTAGIGVLLLLRTRREDDDE